MIIHKKENEFMSWNKSDALLKFKQWKSLVEKEMEKEFKDLG